MASGTGLRTMISVKVKTLVSGLSCPILTVSWGSLGTYPSLCVDPRACKSTHTNTSIQADDQNPSCPSPISSWPNSLDSMFPGLG